MSLVERLNRLGERWGHASLTSDGEHLHVETPRFDFILPVKEIREVRVCRMADEFTHGEEVFHVLIHGNDAFVLGPFLKGALGAIDELRKRHPNTLFRDYRVGRLPFFARHGGLLGRGLFAIPATSVFTFERLEEFEMTIASDETPDFSRLGVWESDHWVVRLHPNQCYLGRCTVVSKRLCDDSLATCTDAEYLDLRKVLQVFERVMEKRFSPTRFNYTQLGNEWPQLHVHAIPRYDNPPDWNGVAVHDARWGQNPTPKGPPPFPIAKVYELASELKHVFRMEAERGDVR